MEPSQDIAFSTPVTAPAWQRWMVFSPTARIVFFIVAMLIFGLLVQMPLARFGLGDKSASPLRQAITGCLAQVLISLLAYSALTRTIERRPHPRELAWKELPLKLAGGLAIGIILFSLVTCIMWMLGIYHVSSINDDVDWLPPLLTAGIGAGVYEEIISRGVLFRIVEEGMGTFWALAVSAAFFGAAHIFNPGATVWSSVAIAIEAGLMLGMLYHVTRSLWPCMGLHAAWNVMQGTVFGIPVSGTSADGWLVSYRTGPDWLSGGVFGTEASVVSILTCSAFTATLLIVAWRRRSFVAPRWRRH
ncbi:type II CAAX endopeptidase family protein [Dyella sp.]|uniref:CPBP family intramembrane glutamic endopeptidase n=1 Tax=Dyella sp. TaxID=1869338 RepID=UPI002ED0AAF9